MDNNMEFVTFELANKLKKKEFKEECLCHYIGEDLVYNIESPIANNQLWFCHNKYDNIWHRDNVDAPTISQVLKWLRDEKNIHIDVGVYPNGWNFFCCSCEKHNNGKFGDYNIYETLEMHNSYELAALAGIEYVLDNLI